MKRLLSYVGYALFVLPLRLWWWLTGQDVVKGGRR